MKNKILLVIEDSSKSNFGGGQKVSLIISNWWNSENGQAIITDHKKPFSSCSSFGKKCIDQKFKYIPCLFGFFKISDKSRSSFSISILELLVYPFLLPINTISIGLLSIFFGIFHKKKIILYCPTKKSLIEIFPLSLFFPVVYHSHNYPKSSITHRLFYFYMNLVSTLVISVSKQSHHAKNKISHFIPNPFSDDIPDITLQRNLAYKISRLSDGIQYFDCFSNHISWKGHLCLVQAVSLLFRQNKSRMNYVRFRFFGDGPLRGEIKNQISRFDLCDHILLPGRTDNVCDILSKQTYFTILPSTSEEACPMTSIESFACGVPIITTNIGGQLQFSLDNYTFNPDNSEQLSILLNHAISLPLDEYSALSDSVLKRSRDYSLTAYRKNLSIAFNSAAL